VPSGKFTANAAWPVLATIAVNLTCATGTLTGTIRAKATTGTIRRNHPPETDRPPREDLLLGPAHHTPPTQKLALGTPMDNPLHQPSGRPISSTI